MKKRECWVSAWKQDAGNGKPGYVEDKEVRYTFHGFGHDIIESSDGNVQFTVAILETDCGKICLEPANLCRFIDKEVDEDTEDAERYRYIREQHCSDGALCVVMNPKGSVTLGCYEPSHALLDKEVDALRGKS